LFVVLVFGFGWGCWGFWWTFVYILCYFYYFGAPKFVFCVSCIRWVCMSRLLLAVSVKGCIGRSSRGNTLNDYETIVL